MDKTPQARPEPTTDEYVTALRMVIQRMPTPDSNWHGLTMQGKNPEVVFAVINDLALELHVRVAKALGAPGTPVAPMVPVVHGIATSNVVTLHTRKGHQ